MWIFLKAAFYSIVEDRNDSDRLLVRARLEGDIERLWPDAEIEHNTGTDYAYRTYLRRTEVALVIAHAVLDIDYGNYKNSVADGRRGGFYAQVWNIMWDMQQALKNA